MRCASCVPVLRLCLQSSGDRHLPHPKTNPFPQSANETSANSSTGITRLSFTSPDGSQIPVEGLSTPIFFTLPPVNLSSSSGDSPQAVCAFYDAQAQAYSRLGCVGQPNPLPPGLSAAWAANLSLKTAADISRAWVLADNGTEGGLLWNCSETVLDCSNASDAGRSVYLDVSRPLAYPAVSCGPEPTDRVLRVFHGPRCRVYRQDNAEGCWWCVHDAIAMRRALAWVVVWKVGMP